MPKQALTAGLFSAALFAVPAVAADSVVSVPDFSGLWTRNSIGFLPPPSGPGPVIALNHDNFGFVGDHTNPILKPEAAERVKKNGETERGGQNFPTPGNSCWPFPTPYFWSTLAVQFLQQKDQVAIYNLADHQVRLIRLNALHPAQVTPSWTGDSIGHYEGDTLVIDTIGIKAHPISIVDAFGTPHSEALYVVERIRVIEGQAATAAAEREERTSGFIGPAEGGPPRLPSNFMGKGLQIQFTIDDPGVFTTRWSAEVNFRRIATGLPPSGFEDVCAENARNYITGKDALIPRADKPDF